MPISGPTSRAYTDDVMREEPPRLHARRVNEQAISLAREWRALGRAATGVALITAPALFLLLHSSFDWSLLWSLVGAFAGIVVFRGLIDVVAHKLIPAPSLYGAEDELKKQDVIMRRRVWYWRHKFKIWMWIGAILLIILFAIARSNDESLVDAIPTLVDGIPGALGTGAQLGGTLFVFFLINFAILFGPLVFLGIQQIK